jgi:hypothetical protein
MKSFLFTYKVTNLQGQTGDSAVEEGIKLIHEETEGQAKHKLRNFLKRTLQEKTTPNTLFTIKSNTIE